MKFTTSGLLIEAARNTVAGLALAFTFSFAPAVLAQEEAPAAEESAAAQETAPAEAAVETIPVQTPEAAPAEGATELDKIEVTGSRLRRTDFESAQPVFVLSREDIERTGLTDISEILRNITAAGNSSLSAQQGRFALSLGETNLDLRNLGSTHTLLLVNGRRWVSGLIPTQTSVSDFNTIPTSIIERVEILKDGASAVYGSDAIGGVVNVITRKDFTGGEFTYNIGQFYQVGDGENQQASLSWGTGRLGGNLYMNLSYTDQAIAPNENRPFTASPAVGATRNSIVTYNGLVRMVNPTPANAALYQCNNLQGGIAGPAAEGIFPGLGGPVAMTAMVPAGLVLCDLTLNPGAEGGNPGDYHEINRANPDDVFNRFGEGTLKEPNERIAFFTQFERPLTDHIGISFEALYNTRTSASVGQRSYLGGGDYDHPSANGYLAHIPESNPNNPFGQDIGLDSSCGAEPEGPTCTGLGTGAGAWAIRRANADNNDDFVDKVDTLRLGAGLKGDIDLFGRSFFWETGYVHGRSKIEEVLSKVNYEKAGRALGTPGTDCDGECVPLNVLQGNPGLSQAAIDFVVDDSFQRNRTQQKIAYLNLSSEIPIPDQWLPGPIAMAVGGEYRSDEFTSDVDPIISQGLIGLNSLQSLSGKTSAREGYVEFGIPLLKDLPAAQSLELNLAGRHSSYPRFGAVSTGKAGLRWQPLEDLLVRSTYSTGFRAPNVGELFLGATESFDPLADPCADPGTNETADMNCLLDGDAGGGGGGLVQPYDLWQGNLDLQPETSKNLTYGLIYSPKWFPDFNVGVDFYDIRIDDFIVIGQGQYYLDSCYKNPNGRNFCDTIHRDGSGALSFVDTPYINLAAVETAGVDIAMDYILPLPDALGRFKVALDTSYLKQYDFISPQPGQADDVDSAVGTVSGQFAGYPRWKAGGYLSWQWEQLKASWSTRMAYHLTEDCVDPFAPSLKALGLCSDPDVVNADGDNTPKNKLDTVFYHNIQVGYDLQQWYNADITLGINNVLNQDPQLSRGLNSILWYNYDPNHYEAPGRFGYLRASFKF